ncbi:flagellar basal body L-ring protein FlgH [Neptunicella sp. SCSIO 80796]|uniref:flagellar basal body L-ring protein FlgH n=1 Tax=Neptunicella plasticusilytica TaxID=3117012 RepID=UPI003A4D6AFB
MRTLLNSSQISLTQRAVILVCLLLCACQSNITSEQAVTQSLATDPASSSIPLQQSDDDDEVKPGDPRYSPVRDVSAQTVNVPTGSLFDTNRYTGLFLQKRQYKIGDMVQIILEEDISAQKQQSLKKDKKSKMDLAPNLTAGFIQVDQNDLNIDHKQSSSFDSSSNSRQSNSLEGTVNVFVNEILDNGNLIVAGEKWIKLNEGAEYVRVYGELRTRDISSSNTISSTKLGNALIEYSSSGTLKDNQQQSVVGKVLSIFQ